MPGAALAGCRAARSAASAGCFRFVGDVRGRSLRRVDARRAREPRLHGDDQDMGRDQIPVSVDGKAYYGCCANCKDKLERQDSARTARDPVTGTRVDKAGAVIARNDAGKVLYFESEQTFAQYTR